MKLALLFLVGILSVSAVAHADGNPFTDFVSWFQDLFYQEENIQNSVNNNYPVEPVTVSTEDENIFVVDNTPQPDFYIPPEQPELPEPVITHTNNGDVIVEHHEFYSPSLMTTKGYNVILPPDYYETDKRYPVLYLLNGLWGDENAWLVNGKIDETYGNLLKDSYISPMIIILLDGDNSAYENGCSGSIVFSCGDYENYVTQDVIYEIDMNYRTLDQREFRSIAGLSIGARGAMRLAFLYPELFAAVEGHSGRYDYLIKEMTDEQWEKLRAYETRIYFDISSNDQTPYYFRSNQQLHQTLDERGISHEYYEVEFPILKSHDWPFWSTEVHNSIRFSCNYICPREEVFG